MSKRRPLAAAGRIDIDRVRFGGVAPGESRIDRDARGFGGVAPGDRRLAPRVLRAGVRDGRRRRRHAAHPRRTVDYRVAADRRRVAAARCVGLERSIRQVPGYAGVSGRQPRDDATGVQADLLVGICPSVARSRDRDRVPRALSVVPRAPTHSARVRVAARGHFRARRAAGRGRLGDGAKRTRRRSSGVAISPDRASRAGVRDFRRHAVDRAVARISDPRRSGIRKLAVVAPLCLCDRRA